MGNTQRGITYPDSSAVVDIEQITRDLAMSADAAIAAVAALIGGLKIRNGTFTHAVAQTDSPTTVVFSEPFGGEGRVFCSLMPLGLAGALADYRWGKAAGASDGNCNPQGFVFQARRTAGATSTIRVNWIAIGPA